MTQNTQEPIQQIHLWSDGGRAVTLELDGLAGPALFKLAVASAQAGQASVFEGPRS